MSNQTGTAIVKVTNQSTGSVTLVEATDVTLPKTFSSEAFVSYPDGTTLKIKTLSAKVSVAILDIEELTD